MWKNYFKVSLRNLSKRKLYTGINILGLTIAIVSFMAIALYIYHEWSYDKMYSGADRIYKVNQEFLAGGEAQLVSTTPSSLVPALLEEIPEVETGTLIFDLSIFTSVLINKGEGNQEEPRFAYADENFFKVFDLPMISGDPASALSEAKQMVITYSTARRYFDSPEEAIGQILVINDASEYTITGVMADFPSNSHLTFDFLASFKSHGHGVNPQWSPSNYYSYIKIRPDADLDILSSKLDQLTEKYLGEAQKSYGFQSNFLLQPVVDIHLGDKQLQTIKPGSDIRYLYIFSVIAVLLIFIGIINYVNLATAEATERNKEVGLRKVMGAERMQLFGQFISESFLLTLAAMVFSIIGLLLLMTTFENISGVPLRYDLLFSPGGIVSLIALVLVVSGLSGMYPALILSGMEPLKALGKNIKLGGNAWLRKGLVIFQFFVSIGLLISTMIVKSQLDYMQSVNLGYEREHLISLTSNHKMHPIIPTLKNEMIRSGAAVSAALAADNPIHIKGGYSIKAGGDNDKDFSLTGYAVDHDVIKTLGVNILAGNDFTDQDLDRNVAFENELELPLIINESAVKEMGWVVEEAVGKKVNFGGYTAYIKAVVGDFYFNSLHHQVGPLALFLDKGQTNVLLVKMSGGNPTENLAQLEEIWKGLVPERPFNYKFVDAEYGQMYRSEERVAQIFGLFSGIAVLIACMGLFGLVSYVAFRRTREISIRKVLGANVMDILKVLSADFFILLGLSATLAIGFGIWFSKEWLSGFSNQAVIPVWIYFIAIGIVGLIALLTISYRTFKVYTQNPAQTLADD
ncbi:MAG TPA: FtsX-like permease family protein [Anditalea sp.]|nr:FtsX-like permease family protein [Anditalea sp.]